jgi:2-methylcitrate dehydratase PrpD
LSAAANLAPNQAAGLTQRLAAAVAALRDGDIPPAAATVARRGLADWLGVAIAGSTAPVVAHAKAALAPLGAGPARLFPGGEACSAREAALINGIAGHVLDYDDVALDGHPSAVLVPALLAAAAGTGATGADFIRGYVAGYESWAMLWAACAQPLHQLGRHPSSHFGPVAAAAGIAALWRLSAPETANAIGLAAAQAGGLTVNFGSMAKSFQLGRAAEAGLLAAQLARAGVDAAPNVLEDSAGFLEVIGGGAKPGAAFGFGGAEWWILREGLDIKIYPVCFFGHRLVDAALQLHRDYAVNPTEIRAIELRLGRVPSKILHSTRPKTVLEAKFSAEFFAAVVLVAGALGLAQLTPDCLNQPEIQRLINVASRNLDDAIGVAPFAPYDQITVHLRDGTSLVSAPVRHAAGSRHAPPTQAEAEKKFLDCTGKLMSRAAAENVFAAAWELPPELPLDSLLAHLPASDHQS